MSPQALQGLQNFQREVRLEETATESVQCTGVWHSIEWRQQFLRNLLRAVATACTHSREFRIFVGRVAAAVPESM